MNAVSIELQDNVNDLLQNMAFKEIHVDSKHYKHIIGKGGVNGNNLKN